jgi:hypothetical protein
MKIQTPTEFLTFTDGKCDIYSIKGNVLDQKLMTLDFGDRTVGIKRFYAARAAATEIDRLIQVPIQKSITSENRAVIDDTEYTIEQAQHLQDTNPPVTVLTLRNV